LCLIQAICSSRAGRPPVVRLIGQRVISSPLSVRSLPDRRSAAPSVFAFFLINSAVSSPKLAVHPKQAALVDGLAGLASGAQLVELDADLGPGAPGHFRAAAPAVGVGAEVELADPPVLGLVVEDRAFAAFTPLPGCHHALPPVGAPQWLGSLTGSLSTDSVGG